MTDNLKIYSTYDVPPDKLKAFWIETFGTIKSDFLTDYGEWWRHGNWDSPILIDESINKVIGHTKFTNIRILLNNQPIDTVWLEDIYVSPNYRGKQLLARMNSYIKQRNLAIGFPNKNGGKVLARDEWEVVPLVGQKLTFPFTLLADRRIRINPSIKGKLARLASKIISPIMGMLRYQQLKALHPENTHILSDPTAEVLSDVFFRHQRNSGLMTTYRDVEHIQWRLLDAPYAKIFYAVGDPNNPELIIVTRIVSLQGLKTLRILDIFGNINNDEAVRMGIQIAMKEAAEKRVDQIVTITTRPNINKICRDLGFYLHEDVSFCWYTADDEKANMIRESAKHWTLADSDFDSIE